MSKKTLILGIVVIIIGTGLFVTRQAAAQTPTPGLSLIQRIAQKFGLQTAQVQSVFDQHKADRMAQMEKHYEDFLTQAVKDGKITDAQKQLLVAKHKELADKKKSMAADFKNMTADQRKAAMQQEKTDLQNWAKQNNIDIMYLFGGRPMLRGSMKGAKGHMFKQ